MNRDVLLGRDVWAGLLFIALGSFTIAHSRDYAMGTLTAMGPGYFPAILGGMMILFGVTMSLGAIVRRAEVRIHPPQVRSVIAICASALCFGLLLDHIGLPITVFCASMIACAARPGFLRLSSFALSVALAGLCVLVFVQGTEHTDPPAASSAAGLLSNPCPICSLTSQWGSASPFPPKICSTAFWGC